MSSVLSLEAIVLDGLARTRDEAIVEAGWLLVKIGAVEESYVAAMHDREKSVSTFMGNGLAIPHGTNEAKTAIRRTALSFLRYDDPIDWGGKSARFVVGIAGAGDDHLGVLQSLAGVFTDPSRIASLQVARSAEDVYDVLADRI